MTITNEIISRKNDFAGTRVLVDSVDFAGARKFSLSQLLQMLPKYFL